MIEVQGLVVVGASAGGVEALRAFVAGLPTGLAAGVCVVLHIPHTPSSALPHILDRAGPLPAVHAEDGMPIQAGRVHVAPPNAHLLVEDGKLRLSHGPTENGHRPAVDPLFRSAARWWGAATVGVVLSGNRDDGATGLAEIVRQGGTAVVQDPAEALYPSMPRQAVAATPEAQALPAAKIGALLPELLQRGARPADRVPGRLAGEVAMAALENVTTDELGGVPTGFGCPTCHGALFELAHERPWYRCRVGHAWSPAGLLDELGGALEGALWMALRSLEEKSELSRRMADSALRRGGGSTAARYDELAAEAAEAGQTIRRLIERLAPLETGAPEDETV